MRSLRIVLAFIAAIWIYYCAVVQVGGILAAVGTSREYFAFFGKNNLQLALALLFGFGWALPVGLLVLGGILASHRLIARRGSHFWLATLLGMIFCFFYWLIVPAIPSLENHVVYEAYIVSELVRVFSIPWWATANVLAPWVALAVAAWLCKPKPRPRLASDA